MTGLPNLYTELVDWWPVLSAPEVLGLQMPLVHSEVEPGTCDIFVGSEAAG